MAQHGGWAIGFFKGRGKKKKIRSIFMAMEIFLTVCLSKVQVLRVVGQESIHSISLPLSRMLQILGGYLEDLKELFAN